MQQKQIARKFVEHWTFRRGSEKGEDQQFWNSLLGDVLGMKDIASRIQYQVPVPMKGTTKFLDAWMPETKVRIWGKKREVKLDQPQAGHGGMLPADLTKRRGGLSHAILMRYGYTTDHTRLMNLKRLR